MTTKADTSNTNSRGDNDACVSGVCKAVGLDVSKLDNELVNLLMTNIKSMIQYARLSETSISVFNSFALHLIQAAMIFFTSLQTPATNYFRSKVTTHKMSSSSGRQKIAVIQRGDDHSKIIWKYIVLSCALPLLHDMVKIFQSRLSEKSRVLTNANNDNLTIDEKRTLLGLQRKAKVLTFILSISSRIIPPVQLYHHLKYILQRKNEHSPLFSMNASGLSYDSMNSNISGIIERPINFIYSNRRLWYDEIMLTLNLLPIDVWKQLPKKTKIAMRQLIAQVRNILTWKKSRRKRNDSKIRRDDVYKCTMCELKPIAIPYEASCGHVYCYVCLRMAISDNPKFRCSQCGQHVESSKPL